MLMCPNVERNVLGSVLLVGSDCLPPGLLPEHFAYHQHEYLYRVITELDSERRGHDVECVMRALLARLPKHTSTEEIQERQRGWAALLNELLSLAQVSMLTDHARLVTEAHCFRSLKDRALELQDAAMRGDEDAAGRALTAAHEVFGLLVKLAGGPVFEVVKGERDAA